MIFLAVSVTQSIAVARAIRPFRRMDAQGAARARADLRAIAGRDTKAARKAVRAHLTRARIAWA